MLKTILCALVLVASSLASAQEEVVPMRMPSTNFVSCNAQILTTLQIPDEVVQDGLLEVSNNFPTEEYTDYLVTAPVNDALIVATMRCYTDGRPMERVF